jgi:tetratricopeptide (TPR) repeat protein
MHSWHQYLLSFALVFFIGLPETTVPTARGQVRGRPETSGKIDLEAQKQLRISELRSKLLIGLDMPPQRRVVLLQWLIELLVSTGQTAEAREDYEEILSLYPNDVQTLNDYGEFLMDAAGDTLAARKVLADAATYTRLFDIPAGLAGRTFFLLGKLHYLQADYSRAVECLESARLYFGSDVPEPNLRLLAQSFARLGQADLAAQTYLELIGGEKGLNPDDNEAFWEIHRQSGRFREEPVEALIAQAVSKETDRNRRELEALGAELVNIATADGFNLEGTLYSSDGGGAVLFVPEPGHLRSTWRVYAQLLHVAGISNLGFDLRGQGGSRDSSLPSRQRLTPEDLSRFPDDVRTAYQFLQSSARRPSKPLVIVAEGAACAWVEAALHNQPETIAVLYLSPLFDTEDPVLSNVIAFRRDRPTLIVYSREDVLAAASADFLSWEKPLSRLEIIRLSRAGHGSEALSRDPATTGKFEHWINELLADAKALSPADSSR